jgi:hypothetical protein
LVIGLQTVLKHRGRAIAKVIAAQAFLADALAIEGQASCRLADEYDAAQARASKSTRPALCAMRRRRRRAS